MNCAQIEELAPLYAGGDLSPEQTALVGEHLDFCERCGAAAEEYEAGRDWLLSAAPPRFDDSFFERLREDIHREIKSAEARRPAFRALGFRFGVAALVVLALIIFAVAYKRIDQPAPKSPLMVNHEPDPLAPQQRSRAENKPAPQPKRRKASSRRLPAPVQLRSSPLEALALNKAADLKAAPEMTRIEFQTADPNIRIIWFTPKTGDSTATNK